MHPLKFTDEFRQQELQRGNESLFYFLKAILGFDKLGDLQYDLCSFLEGRHPHHPWNWALVCAFRGSYKSTCTTQGYPLWRALYVPDWTGKIIENSADNVKKNHFLPMIDLWTSSRRADYLQWLYQHRIPSGFKGWNSEQIQFINENPLSGASLSYWGIDSRFEGWHGDFAGVDDPEGADAAKSDVPNEESWRAIQKCIPLMKEIRTGQILVTCTPHGPNPVAYRIKDREPGVSNDKRKWKVWWKPLIRDDGVVEEPHRFPDWLVQQLQKEDIFKEQFQLLKMSEGMSPFSLKAIEENAFEWVDHTKTAVRYDAFKFELDALKDGFCVPQKERGVVCDVAAMRRFVHVDPTHKLDSQMRFQKQSRPSWGAVLVVGVAPDSHVFPLEFWSKNADIEDCVRETRRLARKWNAHKITFEAVAAQVWFMNLLEAQEKMERMSFMAAAMRGDLDYKDMPPAMLSRVEEANKTTQSKEWVYRDALSPWINYGIIHLHMLDHHAIIHQLQEVANESERVDLVDCLSQGPGAWSPPVDARYEQLYRDRQAYISAFVQKGTGYYSPYRSGLPVN